MKKFLVILLSVLTISCLFVGCSSGETKEHTHSYSAWSVTIPATCTEEGLETRMCSICKEEQTRVLAKTNHVYVEGKCSCGHRNYPEEYVNYTKETVQIFNKLLSDIATEEILSFSQIEQNFSLENTFEELTNSNKQISATLGSAIGVGESQDQIDYDVVGTFGKFNLTLANNQVNYEQSIGENNLKYQLSKGDEGVYLINLLQNNALPSDIDYIPFSYITYALSQQGLNFGSGLDLKDISSLIFPEEGDTNTLASFITLMPALEETDIEYDEETNYHTVKTSYYKKVANNFIDLFKPNAEKSFKMAIYGAIEELNLTIAFKYTNYENVEIRLCVNPSDELFDFLYTNLGIKENKPITKFNCELVVAKANTSLNLTMQGFNGLNVSAQLTATDNGDKKAVEGQLSATVSISNSLLEISSSGQTTVTLLGEVNGEILSTGDKNLTYSYSVQADKIAKLEQRFQLKVENGKNTISNQQSVVLDYNNVKIDAQSSLSLTGDQLKVEYKINDLTLSSTDGVKPMKAQASVEIIANTSDKTFSGSINYSLVNKLRYKVNVDEQEGKVFVYQNQSITSTKLVGNYGDFFSEIGEKPFDMVVDYNSSYQAYDMQGNSYDINSLEGLTEEEIQSQDKQLFISAVNIGQDTMEFSMQEINQSQEIFVGNKYFIEITIKDV